MNDRLILAVGFIAGIVALAWGYGRWTRNRLVDAEDAAWEADIAQAIALATSPLDAWCGDIAAHEARHLDLELWLETGGAS